MLQARNASIVVSSIGCMGSAGRVIIKTLGEKKIKANEVHVVEATCQHVRKHKR